MSNKKSLANIGFTAFSKNIVQDNMDMSNRMFGSFIGDVIEVLEHHKLRVYIRELSISRNVVDEDFQGDNGLYTCEPIFLAGGDNSYRGATNGQSISYGVFGPSPKKGDRVAVIFVNGTMPFWFGTVLKSGKEKTAPGAARGSGENDPNCPSVSTTEKSPDGQGTSDFIYNDNLKKAGLDEDAIRGAGTASIGREWPSYVAGMKSRGRPEEREIGHQFVMDDLPAESGIRLRTSHGHQILISDASESIYINTAQGNNWIEIHQNGKIDIYAKDSVSIKTEADLNFKVGKNFNVDVDGDWTVNVKGKADHTIGKSFTTKIGDFSKTSVGDLCHIKVGADYKFEANSVDVKSNSTSKFSSSSVTHIKGSSIFMDGSSVTRIDEGLAEDAESPSCETTGGGDTKNSIQTSNEVKDVLAGSEIAISENISSNTVEMNNVLDNAQNTQGLENLNPAALNTFKNQVSQILPNIGTQTTQLFNSTSNNLSSILNNPINSLTQTAENVIGNDVNDLSDLIENLRQALPDNSLTPEIENCFSTLENGLPNFAEISNTKISETLANNNEIEDITTSGNLETIISHSLDFENDDINLNLNKLISLIEEVASDDVLSITNKIKSIQSKLKSETISNIVKNTEETAKDVVSNPKENISTGLNSLVSSLTSNLNNQKTNYTNALNNLISAANGDKNILAGIESLKNQCDSIINNAEDSINSSIDSLNNMKSKIENQTPAENKNVVSREPSKEPFKADDRTFVGKCDLPTEYGLIEEAQDELKKDAGQRVIIYCSFTPPSKKFDYASYQRENSISGAPTGSIAYFITRDGKVQENSAKVKAIMDKKPDEKFEVPVMMIGGRNEKGNYETNFTPSQHQALKTTIEKLKGKFPKISVYGKHDMDEKSMHPTYYGNHWWKTGEVISFVGEALEEDVKWMSICIYEEYKGGTSDAKAAVGFVISNRTKTRYCSSGSIKSTVLWPGQFSSFLYGNVNGKYARVRGRSLEPGNFSTNVAAGERYGNEVYNRIKNTTEFKSIVEISKKVLSGTYTGANTVLSRIKSTPSCVLYLNEAATRSLNPNGSWRSWAVPSKRVGMVGAHTFYRK